MAGTAAKLLAQSMSSPPCRLARTHTRVLACLQVYVFSERPNGGWDRKLVHDFKVPVWRVSWSTTGNILAVSDGNNAVTLWKESMDGFWQQVTQ